MTYKCDVKILPVVVYYADEMYFHIYLPDQAYEIDSSATIDAVTYVVNYAKKTITLSVSGTVAFVRASGDYAAYCCGADVYDENGNYVGTILGECENAYVGRQFTASDTIALKAFSPYYTLRFFDIDI